MQPASYDELASHYHLIFKNWEAGIAWQGQLLGSLLETELGAHGGRLRILDCACGIGTQALGLAARGHAVFGTDLSQRAIERARREAFERGLTIGFQVADMRELRSLEEDGFDAVIAADNALPHFLDDRDMQDAAEAIAAKLRAGGVFLATIRDYDALLPERSPLQPPAFYEDDGRRRIVHQVWDWLDDRIYTFHLYITRQLDAGWECIHHAGMYRAVLRSELSAVLHKTGFDPARWLMPAETGYYQPLVIARKTRRPRQ